MHYRIIKAGSTRELEMIVNDLLNSDWKLHGPTMIVDVRDYNSRHEIPTPYMQCLVLDRPERPIGMIVPIKPSKGINKKSLKFKE